MSVRRSADIPAAAALGPPTRHGIAPRVLSDGHCCGKESSRSVACRGLKAHRIGIDTKKRKTKSESVLVEFILSVHNTILAYQSCLDVAI